MTAYAEVFAFVLMKYSARYELLIEKHSKLAHSLCLDELFEIYSPPGFLHTSQILKSLSKCLAVEI